jgi:hypothetical protein
MRDPFRNYDAWLEAPIQRTYAEGDAFVDWCETNDVDLDDDRAERLYQEAIETDQEREAEDRAERRIERELEGREP